MLCYYFKIKLNFKLVLSTKYWHSPKTRGIKEILLKRVFKTFFYHTLRDLYSELDKLRSVNN